MTKAAPKSEGRAYCRYFVAATREECGSPKSVFASYCPKHLEKSAPKGPSVGEFVGGLKPRAGGR